MKLSFLSGKGLIMTRALYHTRKKILLTVSVFVLTFCAAATVYSFIGPTGPVPGKFIVKLKSRVKSDAVAKALGKGDHIARFSKIIVDNTLTGSENWNRFYIVTTSNKSLGTNDIASMLGEDNIEYIEQDYYLEFFDYPDDSLFSNQWYLHNYGQSYLGIQRNEGPYNDEVIIKAGTAGKDIHLDTYYVSPPSESTKVVIAIVDTGADLLHPELSGRFWNNLDEIPGNDIDDDHNGFVDDTLGYDVSGDQIMLFNPVGDNDPSDENGHGTHIAGIVAANADAHGVVGIAPWAEIMPVKIRPNATNAVGAAGIVYAVNAGAQVINISWGTPFRSGMLREAINFARQNGVFVAIAPGNTGTNERFYPAAYDSTFVVAAGNSDGFQTEFSTFGAHIDIVAPGLDILSLRAAGTDMYSDAYEPQVRIIGDDLLYYLADGTSMAAPMVAGAAALMLSFRPDLSLAELEELLLLGADDLIDPLNCGDTLIGPDTISGWGYMNIETSMSLLENGGLFLTEPKRHLRYTEDFLIKAAAVAGYEGGWQLDYSIGSGSDYWQFLATGTAIPADSVLYLFNDSTLEGLVNFRLTDQYGAYSYTSCTHVRQRQLEITSPVSGAEMKYNIPIYGNAYGPDFDSMIVSYHKGNDPLVQLSLSTGEFFDSLLYQWTVSGVDTGNFTICLDGHYDTTVLKDSVHIHVNSAFAQGWPQAIVGRLGLTPACADLNRDGINEVIVPTSRGLYVFNAFGEMAPGFPVLTNIDMRGVPAIYDVDRDGQDEVICNARNGIHVLKYDGSYASGWPKTLYTGQIGSGYGYGNPTVTRLGLDEDSAIVIINKKGKIYAWEFDGTPYFYSLGGLFATFNPRISDYSSFGGNTSPFVTSVDLIGNGLYEMVASYTSPLPYSGLAVFEGRTGQPAFGRLNEMVQRITSVDGTVLADLNGDQNPEIITLGRDSSYMPTIWVKTNGTEDLPGWPVTMPAVNIWIASYPVAADLDLDGTPEILCTFFEYDIAALYIFRADGTPYLANDGGHAGEAFMQPVTFGTPTVANLLGDEYPEIIIRSGYILPGTGNEKLYILDHQAQPVPGWPVTTPARPGEVLSSRCVPLVDDLDGDGLVELILAGDGLEVMVWDFEASIDEGRNRSRFLMDNLNSNVLRPDGTSTDANDETQSLPFTAILSQNYPNPFNPVTMIRFSLSRKAAVKLDVFNILGQKVTALIEWEMSAGRHEVMFDGSNYASGVYFYRLKIDELVQTRKMVLVK